MAERHAALKQTSAASMQCDWPTLFAKFREPVLMATSEGRITGFNVAASSLFGDPARLDGRSVQEIFPFVVPASATDRQLTWEGSIVDAGLRTLHVEVSRTRLHTMPLPITDVYIVHCVADYGVVNRLREQLLTGVAHELREPLSVLDNSLDILTSEHSTLHIGDIDRLLRSARRSVISLRDLMDDLLTAGSIQTGEFRVYPQAIALFTIVEDALLAVQPLLSVREQRVESNLDQDVFHVLADRRSVRQVLAHLLRNASQYSPAGERIGIRATRTAGQVRVTVDDRGPGIPAEQQAGLFERFYRVRPGYDEPGIGLGLAIAKGIIEAHGGSIGVETHARVGTSVWFTLPEAREPGR